MKEEFQRGTTTHEARPTVLTPPVQGSSEGKGKQFSELEVPEDAPRRFRFDRYPRSLFSNVEVRLVVEGIGDQPLTVALHDVSQTGISFLVPSSFSLVQEQLVVPLKLFFEEWCAYNGKAKVCSVRPFGEDHLVGVGLLDDLLDIDEVLRLRQVKESHQRHYEKLSSSVRRWTRDGFQEYKAMVAEFALFLDAAQEELNELERDMEWEAIHGTTPNPGREELFRQIDDGFVREWNEWLVRINEVFIQDEGHRSEEIKRFTWRMLHRYLLQAPVLSRSFYKPLGYPGDFVVMIYIYNNLFEGSSLFGKAVHRGAVNTAASVAVRSRKSFLIDRLGQACAERGPTGEPLKVAAVASGPAQEIPELLRSSHAVVPLDILLFDQDKQALTYSNRNIRKAIYESGREDVQVLSMHDTIRSLFKGEGSLRARAPYDFIYAAGLFDYLDLPLAQVLTRRFYSCLRPGGRIYIGNFDRKNSTRWIMEGALEWFLLHRTPEELLRFTEGLPEDCSVSVEAEATGVNLFLCIRRNG